ncbi:MAG: helix-turn-helix domain-containing protein [Gammaproteobacteria bacterium]|nr:helix-turn-helix domain-containing protein [Gammaproteobacteria bacterium]
MARLNDKERERIIADWKVGVSQNQLAKNYNVSPATINKLCKDVPQENIEIVNSKVSTIRALQEKSECEVNSIEREVNDRLRREQLVYGVQEKAIQKAGVLLDEVSEPQDLKHLVDAVDKASITLGVSQRHSNQNINVNTQNNLAVQAITRKIVD